MSTCWTLWFCFTTLSFFDGSPHGQSETTSVLYFKYIRHSTGLVLHLTPVLVLHIHGLSVLKWTFAYSGAKLWNQLAWPRPQDVQPMFALSERCTYSNTFRCYILLHNAPVVGLLRICALLVFSFCLCVWVSDWVSVSEGGKGGLVFAACPEPQWKQILAVCTLH